MEKTNLRIYVARQ